MNEGQPHVRQGMASQPSLSTNNMAGFTYDQQFMKHMSNSSGMMHADIAMTMPRYAPSANMMVKQEFGGFDNLASHPGLRVQLPSHESLLPQNRIKYEDSPAKRPLITGDQDTSPYIKQQRSRSQLPYQAPVNYNNAYTPNVLSYNMLQHAKRIPDVAVPQIMRFPGPKDAINSAMPKVDLDIGNMAATMAISQLATQQIKQPQPLVKPPAMYQNNLSDLMSIYKDKLNIKMESPPSVKNHVCSGGVICDKGPYSRGGRWLVFWECRGRIWRKSFLISMYGNDGAKELAENFWLSKMRAIQLANTNRYIPGSEERDVKLVSQTNRKGSRRKSSAAVTPMMSQEVDIPMDPSDPPDDPEVFWEAETNSWCFEFLDKEKQAMTIKRFPVDDMNKANAVKAIASSERIAHWRDVIKDYCESEYSGHTYEKSRTCWRVSHWVPSKRITRNKYFNVSKYGYRDAKELSKIYRLLVYDLGGEIPEKQPPETTPSAEFLALPTTKFYHRVLFSMRNKDRA
ncbi:AP2 [Babesia gibsoni]|uniref:AP2 n=1 Tax=Babesia gibsoni TaxID=33632 RepID=A0AAD8PDU0_BABGI|nr:AP2 [Babesia gibsoni]